MLSYPTYRLMHKRGLFCVDANRYESGSYSRRKQAHTKKPELFTGRFGYCG